MKKFLDYRILLILWICIGLSYSGYNYLFPPEVLSKNPSYGDRFLGLESGDKYIYTSSGTYYEAGLLITIIGIIFIGGLGYIISKKK